MFCCYRTADCSPENRLSVIEKGATFSTQFPALNECISIKYEAGRGRYAVANRDIPIGTLLVREQPMTWTLHDEKFGSNCQHCFANIKRVVPCPKCTWVCFCSVRCRDQALQSYHKYECSFLKHLLESGLNVYAFLTTRAVAICSFQYFLDLKPELLKRREDRGSEGFPGTYLSSDFINVYSLMDHEDSLDEDTWILRTLVAVFLLKNFQMVGYVPGSQGLDEDAKYLGTILLKLLNICPSNCHDISEMEAPVLNVFSPTCNKVSLGAAIYPSLALFNHQCDPSFMRCNKGNSVICVSNKNIAKGDEIAENYGLMYTLQPREKRQKVTLSHYNFECQCVPCLEDWPDTVTMKAELLSLANPLSRIKKVKCVKCGGILKYKQGYNANNSSSLITCLVCGHETDLAADLPLKAISRESEEAVAHLVKGDWEIGIRHVEKCHALIDKHLSLPMLELTEAHIAIWKCIWLKFGNMKLVKLI